MKSVDTQNPPTQQPLPTGPEAQVSPQPTTPDGPISFPALPQKQEADTSNQSLALVKALAGTAANIVGMLGAHPQAAGDGLLKQAAEDQANFTKGQKTAADANQQIDTASASRALAQKLAVKVPQLKDPADQAIAMQYLQNEDPAKAQAFIEQQLGRQDSDARHAETVARLRDKLNDPNKRFDQVAADTVVKDYNTAIKEKQGSLRDDAANMLAIEQAARSQKDPNKVTIANLELTNPKLFKGMDKAAKTQLQAQLDAQRNEAVQGGISIGGFHLGGSVPNTATSDQVFSGLAGKVIGPDKVAQHVQAVQSIEGLKSELGAAKFIQANINNRDPVQAQKAQKMLSVLRSKAGQQ